MYTTHLHDDYLQRWPNRTPELFTSTEPRDLSSHFRRIYTTHSHDDFRRWRPNRVRELFVSVKSEPRDLSSNRLERESAFHLARHRIVLSRKASPSTRKDEVNRRPSRVVGKHEPASTRPTHIPSFSERRKARPTQKIDLDVSQKLIRLDPFAGRFLSIRTDSLIFFHPLLHFHPSPVCLVSLRAHEHIRTIPTGGEKKIKKKKKKKKKEKESVKRGTARYRELQR